jgi:uncharacterized protein YcfJ
MTSPQAFAAGLLGMDKTALSEGLMTALGVAGGGTAGYMAGEAAAPAVSDLIADAVGSIRDRASGSPSSRMERNFSLDHLSRKLRYRDNADVIGKLVGALLLGTAGGHLGHAGARGYNTVVDAIGSTGSGRAR